MHDDVLANNNASQDFSRDVVVKVRHIDIESKIETDLDILYGLAQLAERLEEIALKDEYFLERKLYPNVDFYSSTVQHGLGIPVVTG